MPVDALGIQSHIGGDDNIQPAQLQQWRAFVDEVVGMGYKLLITEFDVNDKELRGDIKARDAQVAVLPATRLGAVWGMVDEYSWLQNTSPRPDNASKRPAPYDEKYQSKPLRQAIAAAFESAPGR